MTNHEIARTFDKVAFFLALKDENDAKINAYSRAARSINEHPLAIENMLLAGEDLTKIEGVGKIMAQQLEDLVIIGHLQILNEMLKEFPGSLYEMSQIKGISPKTILKIFNNHKIKSLAELKLFLRGKENLAITASSLSKIQEFFEK